MLPTMWPAVETIVFVSFSLMSVYFSTVECLSCVQCTSLQKPECITGDVDPVPCSLPNATYCIKYEGEVQDIDIKLVVRECSDKNEPSECKIKPIQGKPVNVCFYSCSSDGCNGNAASKLSALAIAVLSSLCLLVVELACDLSSL